ncbi:MAG: hypothetical protein JWQ04_1396, partial [Pedosphaera sp.]|nr:hypothetical protein [Pedosphaera sp.]
GIAGWLYKLDDSQTGPAQYNIQKGQIWPALKDPRLYLCPLDNTNSSLFHEREQQLSSYVENGAVIGFFRTNFPPVNMADMRPDDVIYWEADEQDVSQFNDGGNIPSESISGRHRNGAINGTVGGSVSYMKLDKWEELAGDSARNSLWCYPEAPDGR